LKAWRAAISCASRPPTQSMYACARRGVGSALDQGLRHR
jgi:hypothetical protein